MNYDNAMQSVIDTAQDLGKLVQMANSPISYDSPRTIDTQNCLLIVAAMLRLSANLETLHDDLERLEEYEKRKGELVFEWTDTNSPICRAISAFKSARFEHGQTPQDLKKRK